jgi:aryl-alcohol dehydrogenase-like predicted oxidoreductase
LAAIPSAMEKRRIGNSDLEIAPLVLGGNVFGWTADEATSFRILDAFVDAGGTMVDTADVYSNWVDGHKGGESETVIGRWLKRDPAKRAKVQIATKVGFLDGEIVDGEWVAALQPEVIARACDASLRRLGTDCIDLYYQHSDNPEIPLSDSLGAMDALVKAGKVRAIGLSQYRPDRMRVAVETARREGLTAPCALQTWYNLVERAKLEGPLLDAATECGLGVLSFFSLANGFLTGKYRSESDLAKSARGDRSAQYLDDRGMRVLAALDNVAADTGAGLGAVALAWTIAQPGIAGALASATSVEQLNQNMAALALKLSPEQIARLNEASA